MAPDLSQRGVSWENKAVEKQKTTADSTIIRLIITFWILHYMCKYNISCR